MANGDFLAVFCIQRQHSYGGREDYTVCTILVLPDKNQSGFRTMLWENVLFMTDSWLLCKVFCFSKWVL